MPPLYVPSACWKQGLDRVGQELAQVLQVLIYFEGDGTQTQMAFPHLHGLRVETEHSSTAEELYPFTSMR